MSKELPPMTKWTIIYGFPKPRIREIWTPSDGSALVIKSEGILSVGMQNYPIEEEENEDPLASNSSY